MGGLLILGTLVQVNYFRGAVHGLKAHLMVSAISATWGIASFLFQYALRRERWTDGIRLAWLGTEVVLLTAILRIRDNPTSSTVIVYALLIAAAGLWSRVHLVWWTTATSLAAYVALVVESWIRKGGSGPDNNESIILGVLLVTGCVVAQQVRRILALSSYYEHRQID